MIAYMMKDAKLYIRVARNLDLGDSQVFKCRCLEMVPFKRDTRVTFSLHDEMHDAAISIDTHSKKSPAANEG
jgi:hypothetical protein